MSEDHSTPEAVKQPSKSRKPNRSTLFAYILVLFAVAFLLLLLSYFMQQRRNDQQVIEGLQENASALQITRSIQEQNQTLRQQVADLQEANETLEAQAETHSKTVLALDWLWRIEREFFQNRYSSARQMIRQFEADGLKEFLPAQPIADRGYRSPLEQYEAMYDVLF
ncbi:MAG: hypothetical protein E7450_02300 [Ruminococcaceae bacterium]|nr:hypothetical protein [Oscillospiraceae bacterium]